MLRTSLIRAGGQVARSAARARLSKPMIAIPARFNSSESPLTEEQRKEAIVKRGALQKDWDAPELTYEEVKKRSLQPTEDAYLIDVREPDEVIQGSIPSAVNLPLSVLAGSLQLDAAAFQQKFGYEKPGRNQEVVFYCRSGKRSSSASDVAKRNGYTKVLARLGAEGRQIVVVIGVYIREVRWDGELALGRDTGMSAHAALSLSIYDLVYKRSLVQACHIPATRACQRRVPLGQALAQKRYYATPPPQFDTSVLPIEEYHALSDATMDTMLDSLEALLDELGDPSYEIEYSSGVLTLKLGNNGTYVINKQPPNKQIWLSSPFRYAFVLSVTVWKARNDVPGRSGPKRYDYVPEEDNWIYSRDGQALGSLLNTELSRVFKQEVDLGLADVSKSVV
ncbi:hypothetical protein EVG20_g376 [Dentipellis fragilis]|uniref:Rhodanese domain-containing protein n=1 Tax=Dentipellis fragilis TaxID=205917 RepID=A0A4Y9ZFI6_9AGAM|nr:hypothetical protein EVG20_g376 [Dentipellis fragilis]